MTTDINKMHSIIRYVMQLEKGNAPKNGNIALNKLKKFLPLLSKLKAQNPQKIILGTSIGEINLLENISPIVTPLLNKIKDSSSHDISILGNYLEQSSTLLSSTTIELEYRCQLLLLEKEKQMLERLPKKPRFNYFQPRYDVCKSVLATPSLCDSAQDREFIQQVLTDYLQLIIRHYLAVGQFIPLQTFLETQLQSASSTEEKNILAYNLIDHCSSFDLLPPSELKELFEEHKDSLTEFNQRWLESEINKGKQQDSIMSFKKFEGQLPTEQLIIEQLKTEIHFSIPQALKSPETVTLALDNTHSVTFQPVSTFWQDPMYQMLMGMQFGAIRWHDLYDVRNEEETSFTHVTVSISDFYLPDATLKNGKYEDIDFTEQEAIYGRPCYPHKIKIIELLRKHVEQIEGVLKIQKNQLNIDWFSHFIVCYTNKSDSQFIARKMFAFTNPDAFSKANLKFQHRLAASNISDQYQPIRQLLIDTNILSNKILRDLVYKIIEITVKESIEHNGGYRYLWTNGSPCKEVDAQPYIYNQTRIILGLMGISISREPAIANGFLDFYITYNTPKNELLKVCIELKLAHANNIEHGIQHQLPKYMTGQQTKYGIYMVLWFKGNDFNQPTKYKDTDELKQQLESHRCNTRNISVMLINCSKGTPPSKTQSH